jgi:hypothetical protein
VRRLTASASTSVLERGARGKTTGRKPNKANLLVLFGCRKPGTRALNGAGLELAASLDDET